MGTDESAEMTGGEDAEQAAKREEREAVRGAQEEGHVQEQGRPHRELARLVQSRWEDVRLRLTLEEHRVPGWHDAAEEVGRPQRRKGSRPQAVIRAPLRARRAP